MSQCGASDVTGLCHRVWHVVRQMSQVYATGLACGASDVTGYHRFGMWCVRYRWQCHGVCASDVMSRNVKTAAADICSLEVVELRL